MNNVRVVIYSCKTLFNSFFKINEAFLQYRKTNGTWSKKHRRLSFVRADCVCVLLKNTDTDKFFLLKQFRYPAFPKNEGFIYEIPAGKIDDNESPWNAAKREVLEETGYAIDWMQYVGPFFTSPGGSSEMLHFFYAETSDKSRQNDGGGLEAENEDIEVSQVTLPKLEEMFHSRQLIDAKSILAMWWFKSSNHFKDSRE